MNRCAARQARTQESVHVRVRGPIAATVLVDREDTLDISSRPAERRLNGVADGPLSGDTVQASKALGGPVVDGQYEAEVHGLPESGRVLDEGLFNRLLVPRKAL
jgi:hypothetical protein